ncbi:MAG TPA: alpha/beta hydrolase [Streptosporangiaceae bacterium]
MSDPVPLPTLPPVILVHGFASSSDHNWVRPGWRDALESRGHRVVLMDLPGHGGNTTAGGGLAAVGQQAELAGAVPEVDRGGFSAGARVCALAAAGGLVPVRRLVLAGLGDGSLAGAEPSGDRAAMSMTGPLDEADIRGRLFRRMAATAGNDPSALEAFLAAPAGELTPEVLGRIAVPTLLIIGERDHLGPADLLAASVPGSELVTLPRIDHFATTGRLEAIMAALRFLAG